MHSRAVALPWMMGRGSCGSAGPWRGASRQTLQARRRWIMSCSRGSSDIDDEAVMRRQITLRFDFREVRQHRRAHVREHDARGREAGAVSRDGREIEMVLGGALDQVAFDDEKVGA